MSQTSYSNELEVARNGLLADLGSQDVLSFVAEEEIPFGHAVLPGTDPEKQVLLPAVSGDVALINGVAASTHAIESDRSGNEPSYKEKDMVNVMHKGRIWVKTEEAVVVGDDVYVRYAAGGNGPGAFGKTSGTSERAQLVGAKWLRGAAIDGLALLEIDL